LLGEIERLHALVARRLPISECRLSGCEAVGRSFAICQRRKDRALVAGRGLIGARTRRTDIGPDPPEIEDRPSKRWSNG